MMHAARRYLRRLLIFLTIVLLGYAASLFYPPPEPNMDWGVSFDPVHAEYLGLNVTSTFASLIDDLHFHDFRLGVHWDAVETKPGKFDFTLYDQLMDIAARRGAKVILAVGQKTPRWPECHTPIWANQLHRSQEYHQALSTYIETVVKRYRDNPSLEMWQVENEPLLAFGDCPNFTAEELKVEIGLVRSLDSKHPIIITDSGELSTWRKTAKVGDYFGTTLYRVVWNKYLGYFKEWIPAWLYRLKLWINGRDRATAFVVELQAEPWMPARDVKDTPLAEQFKSLDVAQLAQNIDYARRVGFGRTYLWGAEWWYWMARQGHAEFLDFIRSLPKQ